MKHLVLALVLALLPATALGATWTITHSNTTDGVAVMNESARVAFTVKNDAANTNKISEFALAVSTANYDIEGGDAPAGWRVSAIDRKNRKITYTAASCTDAIAPGATLVVGMRLIGIAASADVSNDTFVTNGQTTAAFDKCSGTVSYSAPNLTGAAWKRVGLGADVDVSPRTLDVNGLTTVSLTVTNHTTGSVTVSPNVLTISGGGGLGLSDGPDIASATIASEASATFTWHYQATSRGIFAFTGSAQTSNATVTSPKVTSVQGDIGEFPALTDMTPTRVTDGQTVTLYLAVSNNSTDPYQNVTPTVPVLSGTATATLLSGPTPSSVATLPASATTSFRWTYRINGNIGDGFQFSAQATGTRDTLPISSDPVGSAQGTVVSAKIGTSPTASLDGTTAVSIAYTVHNGTGQALTSVQLLTPDPTYFPVATTHFVNVPAGWTTADPKGQVKGYTWSTTTNSIPDGGSQTFTLAFSRVGTGSMAALKHFVHRFILTQADTGMARSEADFTVFVRRTVPEVSSVVALSGTNQNLLAWNNPLDHDGVLILRSTGAAPSTAPTPGQSYSAGATVGSATVVYSDTKSFASSLTDTGLTNGTRYFYRVYNHDEYFNYSAGNVPGTSGIFSEPTTRTSPSPLWCYSVGLPTSQQPVTDLGAAVFSSSNAGLVTGNLTSGTGSLDGTERWRPTKLSGAVQTRFQVVPLTGLSGKYIVTGDQSGRIYAINSQTGAIHWRGNGGGAIGTSVQAQPVVQLNQYANTAFQNAHPSRDLIMFATRNSAATNNKVWGVSSITGNQVWTAPQSAMDIVSGGMMVDYATNRVWVPSRSNGGSQPSLWVFSTLDGSQVASFRLEDSDFGVNLDPTSKQVYFTTNGGKVYGFDSTTPSQVWSYDLGGTPSSFVFPAGDGFIASLQSGAVKRFQVTGTTVTQLWSASVPGPSGIFVQYTTQKLFVGGSDGKVYQLDAATGAVEKTLTVGSSALGTPTIDSTAGRLHVGSLDGRICAFQLPLP